jgi:hypothetical protein
MVLQIIEKKQNHKKIISHGAHDISQCTMTKLWNPTIQLTPLNNYLSNCVITSSYKIIHSNLVVKGFTLIFRRVALSATS